ncbi:MAG: glycosyltransferase family 4 protein [Micropepsaceae bacterium]
MPVYLITPGRYLKYDLQKLWFLPYGVLAGIFICIRHKITHVHVSSARAALIGYLISKVVKVRLSAAVHGLDITLQNKLVTYRYLTPFSLRQYDVVVCNSQDTRMRCGDIGLDLAKCHVVNPGVDIALHRRRRTKQDARRQLLEDHDVEVSDKPVIMSVCRLVKRKGIAWFIDSVFPRLLPQAIYLVLGGGPELPAIRAVIEKRKLQARVHLMLDVPDTLRDLAYDAADVLVMPNITVPGDREGFGIVNVEAGMHNLPVVASNIEGIREAVIDGVTGRLVRSADPVAFVEAIATLYSWDCASQEISTAVQQHYGLERFRRSYIEVLKLSVTS